MKSFLLRLFLFCFVSLREDGSSSQYVISVVQHHALSRGNCSLRLIKNYVRRFFSLGIYCAEFFRMMVSNLCPAPHRLVWHGSCDPVELVRIQFPVKQLFPESQLDGVLFRVDPAYVKRFRCCDPEPASLSDRVVDDSPMSAQYISVRVYKRSRPAAFFRVFFDDPGIISIRNETDILTVLLSGIDESPRFRQFPNLALLVRTLGP